MSDRGRRLPGPRSWTGAAATAVAGLAVAVIAVLVRPGAAPVAEAHALLVRSDPPVNSQLLDPPAAVVAFFSEPLDARLSSMEVLDGTGERVDSGETTFGPDAAQMSAALQPLIPGFYTVAWETLSSTDGHLLRGTFPFTVLNPDGSEPSGPRLAGSEIAAYSGARPGWDNVPTKWAGLAAAALAVGGLAFVAWVAGPASAELTASRRSALRQAASRHMRAVAWPSLAALLIVGITELLLQARQLGGLGLMDEALRTFWGQRWIQRQLVLGVMAVSLFASGRLQASGRGRLSEAAVWVALAGGFGYLLLVAMVSHGGSVPGSFWAVAADFAHLLTASVWAGMLLQLALLLLWSRQGLPRQGEAAVTTPCLERFSAIAAVSVAVLLASGAANGLTQITLPEALFDTAYGRALTVKLCLMGLLLAIAGANASYLRPRAAAGDERARSRLSIATGVELALALVVVAAAAVLVQYPTSRQVQAARENLASSTEAVVGFEEIQQAGDVTVDLTISPNQTGTNSFRVFLFPGGDGEAAQVQRVRLRFKPPDPLLGPSEAIAEEIAPYQYKAVGAFFSRPGDWEVQVDLRRVGADDVSAIFRPRVAGVGPAEDRGRFAYPLAAGSWAVVGAAGALLAALLAAIWVVQWPRLPAPAPRILRMGSAGVGVVAFGLLAALLAGLVPQKSAAGNPVAPTGESIAAGRSLFAANCASCHGAEGRGDGPQAPGLSVRPADMRQHVPYHSDVFLYQVVGNGLGNFMPPFISQLSDEERWHVINFLKSEFGTTGSQ